MISSASLRTEIKQCRKCAFLVKSRKTAVFGHGDTHADIMFVGLAPGRNGADITGVPFTRDPSGVLFQEALIKADFSLETDPKAEKPKLKNVYVTNIVKCNPKDENGNNRHPSRDEINNCFTYFELEKKIVKPKVIVTLGKTATEYVLNMEISRFLEIHNCSVTREKVIYIPFIHPSYVIRGSYNREKYIREIISLRNRSHINESI